MDKGERAGNEPIAFNVEKDKNYFWCACGKSKKQPFCDGSHKDTDLLPLAYKATETKAVAMCGCKYSGSKPLCDGSHEKL